MSAWTATLVRLGVSVGAGGLLVVLICGANGLFAAPEWGWPWAFGLLPLVFAIPLQRMLTGANRLAVPGLDFVRTGPSLRVLLAWLPELLQVVGLALCVVALARPQSVETETIIRTPGLDIMLAIDTSVSMSAPDMVPGRAVSRLEVSKAVVSDFVTKRQHDRIGVVVFGERAFTHVPLTLDHDTLLDVLKYVDIGVAGDATAIGDALAVAARRMKEVEAPSRIVILLTDGVSNTGRPVQHAAQAAKAVGIKVYTIGIGASGGTRTMFGRRGGFDSDTLRAIASETGGRYFQASNESSLREVYDTIDRLQPSPAEVEEVGDPDEWFRRALVPGLGLYLLGVVLGLTWLRRGP